MGDEQAGFEICVARIVEPEVRRSLLGKRKVRVPPTGGTARAFCIEQDPDGARRLNPVTSEVVEYQQAADRHFAFVIVSTTPHEMQLEFSAVARDRGGHPFDLILDCSCCVRQLEEFISEVVLKHASPQVPMTVPRAKVWMENTVRTRLREQVAEQLARFSFEELRDREVLQSAWWEKKVNNWLTGSGIAISVDRACWESPDADRAEKERLNQREMERHLEASQKTHELELAVIQSDAAHRAEIEAIRARREMAEEERRHEEEMARVRREIELEKEREELRQIKTRRQAEALAADAETARLNRQEDQACQFEQMKRELLERNQRELEQAKMQLADELAKRLQANPGMVGQIEKDAARQPRRADRNIARRQPAPPPLPNATGQAPPSLPPPEVRRHKEEKKKAMARDRAKAKAAEAQQLMQQLSDVYDNAAKAEQATLAAGDSGGKSGFDYEHIGALFGQAAADSKSNADAPAASAEAPADEAEALAPTEEADIKSASEGLAERLQGVFGSSFARSDKAKAGRDTVKTPPAPNPQALPADAAADTPTDGAAGKGASEELAQRFQGVFGALAGGRAKARSVASGNATFRPEDLAKKVEPPSEDPPDDSPDEPVADSPGDSEQADSCPQETGDEPQEAPKSGLGAFAAKMRAAENAIGQAPKKPAKTFKKFTFEPKKKDE